MDYDREALFKEHPEWRQSDEDEPKTVNVLIYSVYVSRPVCGANGSAQRKSPQEVGQTLWYGK